MNFFLFLNCVNIHKKIFKNIEEISTQKSNSSLNNHHVVSTSSGFAKLLNNFKRKPYFNFFEQFSINFLSIKNDVSFFMIKIIKHFKTQSSNC